MTCLSLHHKSTFLTSENCCRQHTHTHTHINSITMYTSGHSVHNDTQKKNVSHLVGFHLEGPCLSSCTCCHQSWLNLVGSIEGKRRKIKQCRQMCRNIRNKLAELTCRTWHYRGPRWPPSSSWRSLWAQFRFA